MLCDTDKIKAVHSSQQASQHRYSAKLVLCIKVQVTLRSDCDLSASIQSVLGDLFSAAL